jgi:endonuclease YncB( thermonuclease family)
MAGLLGAAARSQARQQPAATDVVNPAAIGPAHPLVTDGDTLRFGKDRVRLWGIDAPEIHQRCPDRWLAGIEASRKMRELVKGHHVICENRGHDRYGRMIGLCRADGVDIQAAMVRAGMAWAFVRYSSDYVQEEAQAKADRLGVFAHGCEPAWEWRAERR